MPRSAVKKVNLPLLFITIHSLHLTLFMRPLLLFFVFSSFSYFYSLEYLHSTTLQLRLVVVAVVMYFFWFFSSGLFIQRQQNSWACLFLQKNREREKKWALVFFSFLFFFLLASLRRLLCLLVSGRQQQQQQKQCKCETLFGETSVINEQVWELESKRECVHVFPSVEWLATATE